MTRKRMVGPRSDGDFAMSIGMGGGRIRKGASVGKKDRRKKQRKTAKPETPMETKKKATRTRRQLERLADKLDSPKYKKRGVEIFNYNLKRSPDRRERINIESKGDLSEEVRKFSNNLYNQDTADTKAVKAYKLLKDSKHKLTGTKSTPDWERLWRRIRSAQKETLEDNFGGYIVRGRNPTVRKVIRKNKKLVKEKFKEQIKKDRAKRKLDESKKRRQRK